MIFGILGKFRIGIGEPVHKVQQADRRLDGKVTLSLWDIGTEYSIKHETMFKTVLHTFTRAFEPRSKFFKQLFKTCKPIIELGHLDGIDSKIENLSSI